MRHNFVKSLLIRSGLAASVLLASGAAVAQQQINLSADPVSVTLPDGATVPMWGYTCGAPVAGSAATCAYLGSHGTATSWSPVVITAPAGANLQINLTDNLTFNGNGIPTSIVIVGQLGGGLGSSATALPSPDHSTPQVATWPIVGDTSGPTFTPPAQGTRVQSFSTEATPTGGTVALTWNGLRPGTYLLESGTHPSIQGPMGLYGILVVTTPPAVSAGAETAAGAAYPGVSYDAEVPLLLSEIDPVQNKAVGDAVGTAGFSETKVWSGQPGGCGNPASATYKTCYPPAVNYSPAYYLVNGVAFDKTHPSASVFLTNPATVTPLAAPGSILVRLVNAGLRMHVPAIVGSSTSGLPGLSLIAEDGNVLPGIPRVQNEVFLAAGKTYDVKIDMPAASVAIPVFDRELSLSGNAVNRDSGMLAYIGANNATGPAAQSAAAVADLYNAVVPGKTLTVSDPGKGVLANDTNVFAATVITAPAHGTLALNPNGTFSYVPSADWPGTTTDTFSYCGNGTTLGAACAQVTLNLATIEGAGAITLADNTFTSNVASLLSIKAPGVLTNAKDPAGYPLTVAVSTVAAGTTNGIGPCSATVTTDCVAVDPSGAFTATVTNPGTYTFTFSAQNSQGTTSTAKGTVTVVFPSPSNLVVRVLDGANQSSAPLTDYRWIIEEDRTFFIDPNCTANPLPAGCPTVTASGTPAVFGTNFHTSYMPIVATGCTGPNSCEAGQSSAVLGGNVVCDQGNGVCRPDATGNGQTPLDPGQVHLDPSKRYYISILPGDAAQPFIAGYAGPPDCTGAAGGTCGHGMGGAPINKGQLSVTVLTQPSPYPTATLSVFVFEDDFPLNGEHDAGGGIDVLSPNEPGLGGFQITLFDDAGGTGDATGQPTYDMFNMPLSNALAGTIDPSTGADACPIATQVTAASTGGDASQNGVVGMIVTCPTLESDGTTLSPLAGQAVVKNLYQGRYGVVATPNADRIALGEEWLQTNTLDGQKAHDSFMRVGEPGYFQEFGPAGYHVTIGFANPKIINDRLPGICAALTGTNSCSHEVKGHVTTARMSRPPDERLYGSGSRDSFAFTQCYVSVGDPDGADFSFQKCADDGSFDFTGLPPGNWKVTIFDQWNDQIVDGISTPVALASTTPVDMGEVAVHQWQANIYTRTFLDTDGSGVSTDAKPGLPLVATNIRFRDGSFSNFNNTDLNGFAGFNEVFPLFSWYVIETDTTRYKSTGTHVVYDAGGSTDRQVGDPTPTCDPTNGPCSTSTIGRLMANTYEANPLPPGLSVPGAVYCAEGADCQSSSIASGPVQSSLTNHSTGRIDPPFWFGSYGWQGFSGQNSFLEFGKKPFAPGENGGIHGHVVYASTRPFDDPQLLLQLSWEPLVPNVTVNLYREDVAPDGVTQTLTLVDTTKTSSFDDWAQGFRPDGTPNMNCPGQSTNDPYYFALQGQPIYLDWYNSLVNGGTLHPVPNSSQYKCYDGMHNWNQLQPAPYDGMYSFPSVTGLDPSTGKPTGTNCTGCTVNPDSTDPYRSGAPMLKPGKYVVEVAVPPGYELVKEEDKNILIGDNFIAPATQQFGGLGSIFIVPDQATVAASYNPNNAQNATSDLGRLQSQSSHEGDTGSVESFWPCVGASRVVPDFISLFPGSGEVSPFAGATRNLCDRKEVTLTDNMSALAKFYVFTSTHVASHFTGLITDDFTAEFDPYSPQFGEKFAPSYLPVAIKDWAGNEIARTYSDQFGAYNGLNYSTWEVNPPNPTGYGPTMMVVCMNDAGQANSPDPLYQSGYSQFCYELPFMPGQTGYFDTPVVPTSAFSEGFNHPDCNYPAGTPAIGSVTSSDIAGPWVSAAGSTHTLTITALGDQLVDNYGYSGPSSNQSPFNQKKVLRHYGFGPQTTANGTGTVTIGGRPATVTSWSDAAITVAVPAGIANCSVQQQAQFGGSTAQCGELVITTGDGKQTVDTVTVTVGGKTPTVLTAGQTIQSAIDAAKPGDEIIVPAGSYNEMVLMWKPVRLQGVGAASSVVNASTQPAGQAKLSPWRRQVVCLFGLALDGTPITGTHPYDPSGTYTCDPRMQFSVDRLPLEATVGWTATLNGNLAEQIQEPTLMGAYEGAGITVLAKGVRFPANSDPFASDVFPTGTVLLTGSVNPATGCGPNTSTAHNPFPSNFQCNPSRIDGLGITNSSQGGGGIFVHGWAHNLEIANNRVRNNQGTLSGGITVGQGEHPDVYQQGNVANTIPGSCRNGFLNQLLPYCFDLNVNVHHNAVTQNSSEGDELFSSTPAGAGGVSFCSGSDFYKFNYNWVCGNMSTGDGGGVAHIGFTWNGDIEHNSILFNQSTNPTITTNGGGLLVMGAPDADPPCAANNDKDCLPAPNQITPSDGTGPNLTVNANLLLGNSADSGSGGGLRLQHINGTDVTTFPTPNWARCLASGTCGWNSVSVTNNIIANNVAGWDGAGVSLQDALNVNVVNNTIVDNDSTASSGVLFQSLFGPLASSPGTNCTTNSGSGSCPQVAGLVSVGNSPVLTANLPANVICPPNHGSGGTTVSTGGQRNGSCRLYSVPLLANDVIWQNRSFDIGVGNFGTGNQNQQKVIQLFNAITNTAAANQPRAAATVGHGNGVTITGGTGACTDGATYWDVGVRNDTGPHDHTGGLLSPQYTFLSDITFGYDAAAAHNSSAVPNFLSQYCNGSRVPPEDICRDANGSEIPCAWAVPPGTNETNAMPAQVFTLLPSGTVDEGNNWVNMRWGPLALTNPVTGNTLANYSPASGSPAVNYISLAAAPAAFALAPSDDFFGNPRKVGNNPVDAGAVEIRLVGSPPTLASIAPASGGRGATVAVTITGTNLDSTTTVAINGGGVTCTIQGTPTATSLNASCAITGLAALGPRTVTVTNPFGTATGLSFRVTGATLNIGAPVPALTSIPANTTTKNGVITVSNTAAGANAGPFVFTAAPAVTKLLGPASGQFTITGGTCVNGFTLNAGSSCAINVRYTTGSTTASTAIASVTGTGTVTGLNVGLPFLAN